MFSMVEIEINSRCNRRCTYCPNVVAPREAPKAMKPAQFDSILDRLEECHFSGRLSYHFYNCRYRCKTGPPADVNLTHSG